MWITIRQLTNKNIIYRQFLNISARYEDYKKCTDEDIKNRIRAILINTDVEKSYIIWFVC